MTHCIKCRAPSPERALCDHCYSELEAEDRALVGERVGMARVEDLVRRGSLATVYRGHVAEEEVAIKVYRRPPLDSDLEERVQRERDAQRKLHHPCVAPLLDSGRLSDGKVYLISEWVDGLRLEDRLLEGALSWDEIQPILAAVGRGLAAVHAEGVVHRDIKPANIMLPASGEPAAVILDFGHALVLDEERLTEQGWILGSAAYMAPEQAAGVAVDGRADLYALGVVLYRALTGSLPFQAATSIDVLTMRLREPFQPPTLRAPERQIPTAVEDLCLWLLAKDPGRRVPSAQVLAITLGAVKRGIGAACAQGSAA